jgi:hypothetical protein
VPKQTASRGLSKLSRIPDFAPTDPTDGREPGDWRSKYTDPDAWRSIWFEAAYLAALLFGVPIAIGVLWFDWPKSLLKLSDEKYQPVLKYGLAWLSGVLGGTLFDVKWLYHSVARRSWHVDRRLWRLFTPHISGALAFAVIAIISSQMMRVFDRQATQSRSLVVGLAFLVGYFSDSAAAKLAEIAESLFGAIRGREKHRVESEGHTSLELAEAGGGEDATAGEEGLRAEGGDIHTTE